MAQKKKLPKDTNQKAKSIVDLVTGSKEETSTPTQSEISKVMSAMGKKGGQKGGPARAKKLSSKRRSEIAKKAAAARWGTRES